MTPSSAFTTTSARGSLPRSMPPPTPLTLTAPPGAALARLGAHAWPDDATARRSLVRRANVRRDGTWEVLWAWAWAGVARLDAPGLATLATDYSASDASALVATVRASLEARAPVERPPSGWASEVLGYPRDTMTGTTRRLGWPVRGPQLASPEAALTVLPPTTPPPIPAASEAPVTGPQPPRELLDAIGLPAWPDAYAARSMASAIALRAGEDVWERLVRWAAKGRSTREEMELLGRRADSAHRIHQGALADLNVARGTRRSVETKRASAKKTATKSTPKKHTK